MGITSFHLSAGLEHTLSSSVSHVIVFQVERRCLDITCSPKSCFNVNLKQKCNKIKGKVKLKTRQKSVDVQTRVVCRGAMVRICFVASITVAMVPKSTSGTELIR